MSLSLKRFILLLLAGTPWLGMTGSLIPAPASAASDQPVQSESGPPPRAGHWITADHSRFPELQKEFASGPELTAVCLSCHNEAGRQVQETIHWTWICPADSSGRMGKNGITLNNF
jgi:hypothetical protein